MKRERMNAVRSKAFCVLVPDLIPAMILKSCMVTESALGRAVFLRIPSVTVFWMIVSSLPAPAST